MLTTGRMTMIGVECDQFTFLNEEQLPDGNRAYVDEWEFRRK